MAPVRDPWVRKAKIRDVSLRAPFPKMKWIPEVWFNKLLRK